MPAPILLAALEALCLHVVVLPCVCAPFSSRLPSTSGYFFSGCSRSRFQPYDFRCVNSYEFMWIQKSYVTTSTLWSRFSPPSDFVNGLVSTMWFMVCCWPQSQEGDWARRHLCKLARHGPWPVWKRFIRDHVWLPVVRWSGVIIISEFGFIIYLSSIYYNLFIFWMPPVLLTGWNC